MRLNWHRTEREGRRALLSAGLGPTWVTSPWRRWMQMLCLLAFLVLFFYVTWPYSAQPAPKWPGWGTEEVDPTTGRLTLVLASGEGGSPRSSTPFGSRNAPREVFLGLSGGDSRVGAEPFRVVTSKPGRVELEPVDSLSAEQREWLAGAPGPWVLSRQPPGTPPTHYADSLQDREVMSAETFLVIDPLAGISASLAARRWVGALTVGLLILAVCLIVPRGFCGYVCPLGTLIDLFDFFLGKWLGRLDRLGWRNPLARADRSDRSDRSDQTDQTDQTDQPARSARRNRPDRWKRLERGWWVHLKYYVLAGTLAAAATGVMLAGTVSAIPVLTRGMALTVGSVQLGMMRGWHQVPPLGAGGVISILLFGGVFALGLISPRFWCRYVCPTGAIFSLTSVLGLGRRRVAPTCTGCGRCERICPFDAIQEDFSTRTADCTFCQTCGGVCASESIIFATRSIPLDLFLLDVGPEEDVSRESDVARVEDVTDEEAAELDRRRMLAWSVGVLAGGFTGIGLAGTVRGTGGSDPESLDLFVRPPGSLPERDFLRLCVRCGLCFQACPNRVLQPVGFDVSVEHLWTPRVVANWAGCEPSCNLCGQVCPTGAIRPLPLEEKQAARIGLARIDQTICLPYVRDDPCQLCVDECTAAGYDAIEFERTHTRANALGQPIEGTSRRVPIVLAEKCVGCGLCQTRCHAVQVGAVIVEAGEGREDRLATGSYVEQRRLEEAERQRKRQLQQPKRDASGTSDYNPILP